MLHTLEVEGVTRGLPSPNMAIQRVASVRSVYLLFARRTRLKVRADNLGAVEG